MKTRQWLIMLVTLPLALAALWWVGRDVEWRALAADVRNLRWSWIGAAVFFDIASYVAQGWRWKNLLRREGRVGLLSTTRAIYAGLFVNEIAPMRPGEALRAWLMAREMGCGIWKLAPSIVTERLLDGALLAASVLAAGSFVTLPGSLLTGVRLLAAVCMAGVVAAMLLRRQWSVAALAGTAAVLGGQGLAYWCVLRAAGIPLGLTAGLIVMLVVRVGTLLPGAPANLGTHQISTVFGLALFGIPKSVAAPFSMIVFGVLTIPLWLLGLAALLSSGVKVSDAGAHTAALAAEA